MTEVLFLGGRSGVGKTSVAVEMSAQLAAHDVRHAVIEGDALDLAHPPPWEHHLAERNLAAIWRNYTALGYSRLIYTNTNSVRDTDALVAALGGRPRVTAVLLTASDRTASERLARREIDGGYESHVDRSRRAARALDSVPPSVLRVATDGRTVPDLARELVALWLRSSA